MADQSSSDNNSNETERQSATGSDGDIQPNDESTDILMVRQLIHQAVQTLEPSASQNNVDQIMQHMLKAFDVSNWMRWFSPLSHFMTSGMENVIRALRDRSGLQVSKIRKLIQARTNQGSPREPSRELSLNQDLGPTSPESKTAQNSGGTDTFQQQPSSSFHPPAYISSQIPPEAIGDSPISEILSTSGLESDGCDGYCMIIAFPLKSQEQMQKTSDVIRLKHPLKKESKQCTVEHRKSSGASETPEMTSKRLGSPSLKEPPTKKRVQIETAKPNMTAKSAHRKNSTGNSLRKLPILTRPKRK